MLCKPFWSWFWSTIVSYFHKIRKVISMYEKGTSFFGSLRDLACIARTAWSREHLRDVWMKILRESWLDWYSTHSKYSTEKREKLEENLKVCENLAYVSPNLDPELNIAADVARIVWLVPLVHDFLYTGLPFQTAVILIHHRAIVSTYASYATNCSS